MSILFIPHQFDHACFQPYNRWLGSALHHAESANQASRVFRKTYLREGIAGDDLVLHSDNGSPMKGATMLATLQRLGVMPSFSRVVQNIEVSSGLSRQAIRFPRRSAWLGQRNSALVKRNSSP